MLAAWEEYAERPGVHLDMQLAPGDLQLVNNYTVMHWRTAFQDAAEPEKKRLLLRLWVTAPDARSLDPEMGAGYITGAKTGAQERTAAHA